MKNLFILLAAVLIVNTSKSVAQNQLKITISTEKRSFQLGEPIVVYSTLTNLGEESIKVFSEIRPETDIYRFFITDPNGKTTSFSPIYVEEPEELTTLGPNEDIRGTARIFFGAEGYYFPISGNYQIQVQYKEVLSNLLEIKVLQARNEDEKEQAILVLEHPEMGFFLMIEGSDALSDALSQIEILNKKYPNSKLSPYFLYGMGKNFSVPKRNFLTKQPRNADLPRAIEILESIKGEEMQIYYQNKVFLTLSFCFKKQNRMEEARQVLLEFIRILDSNPNIQPYYIDQVKNELENIK